MMQTGGGRRILRTWLGGLLMALAAPAFVSAAMDDAVTVALPEDGAAREQVRVEALGRMLQRLAGRPLPEVRAALAGEVQQYISSSAERQQAEGAALILGFDVPALRAVLAERGVPVWLHERPQVVVWAGLADDSGRRLLGGDDAAGRRLRAGATAYGVPALLPVLDLTDRQAVAYTDLTGGFSRVVARASRRYGTSLALMVAMQREGAAWRADWTLVRDGSSIAQGRARGDGITPVSDGVWADVAARLREDYTTLAGGGREGVVVTVTNLHDLAALASAERRLAGSVGVVGVRLTRIRGSEVRFRLTTEVPRARLRTALDSDGHWQSEAAPGDGAAELIYRWRGGGGSP